MTESGKSVKIMNGLRASPYYITNSLSGKTGGKKREEKTRVGDEKKKNETAKFTTTLDTRRQPVFTVNYTPNMNASKNVFVIIKR